MLLPSKALLVVGILLATAEAWARADRIIPVNENDMQAHASQVPLVLQTSTDGSKVLRISPYPHQSRQTHDLEKKIWSERRRGPVDFLSLSMGGALLLCIVVVIYRRRMSANVAAAEASEDLPPARVVNSNAKPSL